MRTVLLWLHVAPGIGGLLAGLLAMRPPRSGESRRVWQWIYTGCVGLLLIGLIGLVAYDWSSLNSGTRQLFAGLAVLGAVMVGRVGMAWHVAHVRAAGWQQRYIGHVSFGYVSLWVGFLIVPAVNSSLPALFVPLVVIVVPLIGIALVARYKRRVPR